MKKVFILSFIALLLFSGCRSLKESNAVVSDISEDVVLIENIYDEKTQNHDVLKSLQGSYQYVGTTKNEDIVFIANNKLYLYKDGAFNVEIDNIKDSDEYFYYHKLNNDMIIDFNDRYMNQYSNDPSMMVSNLKLSKENETVVLTANDWYSVVDGETQKIIKYEIDENGKWKRSYSSDNIKVSIGNETKDFDGAIIPCKSINDGIHPFYLDGKNELYYINNISIKNGECTISIDENVPSICNVESVLMWNGSKNYSPIYSQVQDNNSLYIFGSGNKFDSNLDDSSVEVVLPNGLTVNDIVEIHKLGNGIIVVFSNNDVYFSRNIYHEFNMKSYMQKNDVLSKMYSSGIVRNIASKTNTSNPYIYITTKDGGLYAYDVRMVLS